MREEGLGPPLSLRAQVASPHTGRVEPNPYCDGRWCLGWCLAYEGAALVKWVSAF